MSILISDKIIIGNLEANRINQEQANTITFRAGGSNTLYLSGNSISHPGNVNIYSSIVSMNISNTTVTTTGVLTVTSTANINGNLTIGGNATVSSGGTLNTSNLLVLGAAYHKTGAWDRLASNVITNGSNIKIWNIDTSYKMLRLTFFNLVPDTSNTILQLKFSTDGGATTNSTGYQGLSWHHANTLAAIWAAANCRTWASSVIDFESPEINSNDVQAPGVPGFCSELFLGSFGQAEKTKIWGDYLYSNTTNWMRHGVSQGWWNYQVVNNGLDIYYSSNSTFSGTVHLDGIR